ncbi:MAG: chorismate synthase [Oscillospiraceae bacterium]|nr:chorismate synthase [Oscillospiraceae bacterium]
MSSSYGENLRLTIFGQSHSPAVGMTLEGLPAGERIDLDELRRFMLRRAPGRAAYSTARREADEPEFLSGLRGDVTCGAPLTAIIRNTDTRSADYAALGSVPRPGHADYTAALKYGGSQDSSGGGHFSGRLTAPLCVAGGICAQLLRREGIEIISRILALGGVRDEGELTVSTAGRAFPVVNAERGEEMKARILQVKALGDSVGGIIECRALHLPAGLGDPMFGGMENRIAAIVFGIPAVKGIEFGAGFAASEMTGSASNDAFVIENGAVTTATNNCGGILGGISDGAPLVFTAAIKPTPSIALEQDSVDMQTMQPVKLRIQGRHDPCIVPRAVPCIEAAAAVAIYDALLARRKETR